MATNNSTRHITSCRPVSAIRPPFMLRSLRNLAQPDQRPVQDPMLLAGLQAQCLRELTSQPHGRFDIRTLHHIPKIRIHSVTHLPVAGTAMWSTGAWRIEVNDTLNEAEQRFTVLHELKHILDSPDTANIYLGSANEIGQAQELAADYFAASVLVPTNSLRIAVKTESSSRALASQFGTTEFCIQQRLRDTGLATLSPATAEEDRS